jgi:hypothetical protein
MTRARAADAALSLAIGVVVLGPFLLHRGFALRGDMVLVPHQPWKDAWLALDGSAPRFVPGDALLAVVTSVVPGDLLQKALLLGALLLAGTGAGRLVADRSALGRAAAIVLFTWNPWVLERLSIGQWGSVVGYAALPYVVLAAVAARDGRGRGRLLLWLAFCALWSPAAGVVGALTAFCVVVVGRRLRPVLVVAGSAVVVNLPWLGPALVSGDRIASPGAQFEAFAARGESGAGLLASLFSLGGIWKTSVVPGERTIAVVVLLSCVTTVLALVAGRRTPERRGLLLLAGVAFALAAAPAVPGVAEALDTATRHVPSLAALRDGHRYLGPAVLVLLPGIARAVEWLWAAGGRGREALRAVAVVAALFPALCLPSFLWGLNGDLRPVTYPGEWFAVASVVDDDVEERGGATVVLPWHGTYRGFDWNDSRAMLDPAPRFFAGEVLIDDRIYLRDRTLDNEDPRLAAVTAALADDDPAGALTAQGVARVLVEKDNGVLADEVPVGEVVHDGRQLTLIELDDPAPVPRLGDVRRGLVVAGDLLAGLACLAAAASLLRRPVYGDPAVHSGRGTT